MGGGDDAEGWWRSGATEWSDRTPTPRWFAVGGNEFASPGEAASPWGSTVPWQLSPLQGGSWFANQQRPGAGAGYPHSPQPWAVDQQSPQRAGSAWHAPLQGRWDAVGMHSNGRAGAGDWPGLEHHQEESTADPHSPHPGAAYHPRSTQARVPRGWDAGERPGAEVWPAPADHHEEGSLVVPRSTAALAALQGRWCDEHDPTVVYVVTGLSCVRTMAKNKVTVRQYEFDVDEENQVIRRGDKTTVELSLRKPKCCTPTRVVWRCNRQHQQLVDGKRRRWTFVWVRPLGW
mmetsp:Transcript_54215/g.124317  ORF Transcript_54215/g.124317 Transcript_54215/m.124317 type:complete len:289 (-) Transcript_54215:381-1247(-)